MINQFPIAELFPGHPASYYSHLIQRVKFADAVTTRELIDVALQVLGREVVVDAFVRPFQHAPEAFYAVGMCHPPDVLADAMADALVVVRHALVGTGVVGVDGSAVGGVVDHEPL